MSRLARCRRGTAYGVWVGIGAVGTATSIVLFNELAEARLVFLGALMIVALVGLKATSSH